MQLIELVVEVEELLLWVEMEFLLMEDLAEMEQQVQSQVHLLQEQVVVAEEVTVLLEHPVDQDKVELVAEELVDIGFLTQVQQEQSLFQFKVIQLQ
jgi:3-isopropylmalate dehydratase small subunit